MGSEIVSVSGITFRHTSRGSGIAVVDGGVDLLWESGQGIAFPAGK
jgi:hypothetical protein